MPLSIIWANAPLPIPYRSIIFCFAYWSFSSVSVSVYFFPGLTMLLRQLFFIGPRFSSLFSRPNVTGKRIFFQVFFTSIKNGNFQLEMIWNPLVRFHSSLVIILRKKISNMQTWIFWFIKSLVNKQSPTTARKKL